MKTKRRLLNSPLTSAPSYSGSDYSGAVADLRSSLKTPRLFGGRIFRDVGILSSRPVVGAALASPLVSAALAAVLMEGTDLAKRRPCFSSLPCSHLERCWRTLIVASFSRSSA